MLMNPFMAGSSWLLFVVLAIWTLFWKGYAIWNAARNGHKGWFVAILVLNTVGLLEIYYIFKVANKSTEDVKRVLSNLVSLKLFK